MRRMPMIGKQFGQLTVISCAGKAKGHLIWECLCSCGGKAIVEGGNLRSGHTKSCGNCARYEDCGDGLMLCRLPDYTSFLISKEDFAEVSKHRWSVENTGYVHTMIGGKHIRLHKYLMPDAALIDHVNGIRSDNRRQNLRAATAAENVRNQRVTHRSSTGYKGAYFDRRRRKYYAKLSCNYKAIFLGYFDTAVEAARAYDKAAVSYFGDFACLNFPGNEYQAISG